MHKLLFTTTLLFISMLTFANDSIAYIQNKNIKIGVNMELGGAITYLSLTNTNDNVINNFDWGRQIQMSFYSGPKPYIPESGQKPHPRWQHLGWNPIQSGDVGRYHSKVIDSYVGKDSIYVKSIPMQWPLSNVPGECFFESHIKIHNNTIKLTNRLINERKDKTQYKGRHQELPAVYVNAPYHRLMTYKGDKPFTNDEITEIPQKSTTKTEWSYWNATECWCAHVDDDGFGLGVITPEVQTYIGGFSGKKGIGGTKDVPTGYCAPILTEILDYNIVYEYTTYFLLGDLEEIRSFAQSKIKAHPKPYFKIEKDRSHLYYKNASDQGFPIEGELSIKPSEKRFQILTPEIFYPIDKNISFVLNACFPKQTQQVKLICLLHNSEKTLEYPLAIEADGLYHNYNFHLRNRIKNSIIKQLCIEIEVENLSTPQIIKLIEFGFE